MISTDLEQVSESITQTCAECGGSPGNQEARRIIISYYGDSLRVMSAIGSLRRTAIAFGLRLRVSKETRLPENTLQIACSCMISAPADFMSLSISPTSPLQSTIRSKVGAHGALSDLIYFAFGPSSWSNCQTIRRNTFVEYSGSFDPFGNLYEPEKNRGKVSGLWHAALVPFPHFCQWRKLHASSRMWSAMWTPQTELFLPGLTFPWLDELAR